jgi:hypothetical protein
MNKLVSAHVRRTLGANNTPNATNVVDALLARLPNRRELLTKKINKTYHISNNNRAAVYKKIMNAHATGNGEVTIAQMNNAINEEYHIQTRRSDGKKRVTPKVTPAMRELMKRAEATGNIARQKALQRLVNQKHFLELQKRAGVNSGKLNALIKNVQAKLNANAAKAAANANANAAKAAANANANAAKAVAEVVASRVAKKRILSEKIGGFIPFTGNQNANASIRAVSENAYKQIEKVRAGELTPAQAAQEILKQSGTNPSNPRNKGWHILQKMNWNALNNSNKGRNATTQQIIRYIRAMVRIDPPYTNRGWRHGNRPLIRNNAIPAMQKEAFERYLNGLTTKELNKRGLLKGAAIRATEYALAHQEQLIAVGAGALALYKASKNKNGPGAGAMAKQMTMNAFVNQASKKTGLPPSIVRSAAVAAINKGKKPAANSGNAAGPSGYVAPAKKNNNSGNAAGPSGYVAPAKKNNKPVAPPAKTNNGNKPATAEEKAAMNNWRSKGFSVNEKTFLAALRNPALNTRIKKKIERINTPTEARKAFGVGTLQGFGLMAAGGLASVGAMTGTLAVNAAASAKTLAAAQKGWNAAQRTAAAQKAEQVATGRVKTFAARTAANKARNAAERVSEQAVAAAKKAANNSAVAAQKALANAAKKAAANAAAAKAAKAAQNAARNASLRVATNAQRAAKRLANAAAAQAAKEARNAAARAAASATTAATKAAAGTYTEREAKKLLKKALENTVRTGKNLPKGIVEQLSRMFGSDPRIASALTSSSPKNAQTLLSMINSLKAGF